MANFSGKYIGRYHILEQLGEGGMAVVYKAYDTNLERDVAVKFIRTGEIGPNYIDQMLKRFEREAKALAKFDHPNIITVFEYGKFEETPFLVMQYQPGGSLREMTASGEPMDCHEAVTLIKKLAGALIYSHKRKVIHRDIKPANVLITEEGEPKLTDFGIAKILDLNQQTLLTNTGVGIGTPEYMASEQFLGGKTDGRTDVYALGVVLYELVTGRRPYQADTPAAVMIKQTTEALPSPLEYNPLIGAALERVLIKALAKEPEHRYQSMFEFSQALQGLLDGSGLNSGADNGPIIQSGDATALDIEEVFNKDNVEISVDETEVDYINIQNYSENGSNDFFIEEISNPEFQAKQERQFSDLEPLTTGDGKNPDKKRVIWPWFLAGIVLIAICLVLAVALFGKGVSLFQEMNYESSPTPIGREEMLIPASKTSEATQYFIANTATETATITSTETATLTWLPTETEEISATPKPTNTAERLPTETPYLLLDMNYFCRDGPATSYRDRVDFYAGTKLPVIGSHNDNWWLVEIDMSITRAKCCWIGGGTVIGDENSIPYVGSPYPKSCAGY
ncbi:MAG: serine/threonine protein kinase [Anaerolineaceae bacterium]|nr:serine/threonine protein kinase [Anaerolineaceae bacterium]